MQETVQMFYNFEPLLRPFHSDLEYSSSSFLSVQIYITIQSSADQPSPLAKLSFLNSWKPYYFYHCLACIIYWHAFLFSYSTWLKSEWLSNFSGIFLLSSLLWLADLRALRKGLRSRIHLESSRKWFEIKICKRWSSDSQLTGLEPWVGGGDRARKRLWEELF